MAFDGDDIWAVVRVFQESDNVDDNQLFLRQLGGGRLLGDPNLLAAVHVVGRHGNVVHGHIGVQNHFVLSG